MALEHFDVLIMGAGLSGIDAAHHLQKFCPNKSYVILEQRERIGGTWDLFRYPGIRSDSDMLTMGYSFRPWTQPQGDFSGRRHPRLHHRHGARRRHRPPYPLPPSDSARASWSSEEAQVDRRCGAQIARRTRRTGDADLQLFVFVRGLLPLFRGLHAGVS